MGVSQASNHRRRTPIFHQPIPPRPAPGLHTIAVARAMVETSAAGRCEMSRELLEELIGLALAGVAQAARKAA